MLTQTSLRVWPKHNLYNPGHNDWDNQLKINPEIKFPSKKSKFTIPRPLTMLMIISTNPSLLLFSSSQHWTGGDDFLDNLVNCNDHVLRYTDVPMNFDQDCLKINDSLMIVGVFFPVCVFLDLILELL